MDMILYTSKIRVRYPYDRQQPKAFKVYVGRSTGSEFTINVVEPTDDVIAPIVSVY